MLWQILPMLLASGALQAEPEAAPGAGREVFIARCTICHSIDYVEMHARFGTRQVWETAVNKMRNAFKAPLTDERQYGPQRTIASSSMSNTSVAPGLIAGGEPRSP
jgi:hypothetical protein